MAIRAFLLLFSISQATVALAADGNRNDRKNQCLFQEIKACEALNPIMLDGGDILCPSPDPRCNTCNDEDKKNAMIQKCEVAATEWCKSFPDGVNPPEGCPGHDASGGSGGNETLSRPVTNAAGPPPNPTQPARQTTPSPQTTQADIDITEMHRDLNSCTQLQENALRCCGNPQSCLPTAQADQQTRLQQMAQQAYNNNDDASLGQICAQAYKAGSVGSNLNNDYANVCMNKHSACESSCSQYYSRWSEKVKNCTGKNCDQAAQLLADFDEGQATCEGLEEAEANWRDTALSVADNGGLGNYCAKRQGLDPDSYNPNNPFNTSPNNRYTNNQPRTQPQPAPLPVGSSECGTVGNIAGCVNCALNPDYPSCGGSTNTGTPADLNPKDNTANERSFAAASAAEFNNSDASAIDRARDAYYDTDSAGKKAAIAQAASAGIQATASAGIGAFPPITNPSDLSAALISKARALASASKADIFKGDPSGRGGGGYSPPPRVRPRPSSGYDHFIMTKDGRMIASTSRGMIGLDLKKYLPGGEFHHARRIGGQSGRPIDIGPMSVDMFARMSTRLTVLCSQKRLIGCK